MTDATKALLEELADETLFELIDGRTKIYFAGGTALSYYLDHRISYDLDFICTGKLPANVISAFALSKRWKKYTHINESTFRIQRGESLDNYIQTYFTLDNVKVEFFFAEHIIQQDIFGKVSPKPYRDEAILHILDLPSIVRFKTFALLNRQKSRDMFDVAIMLNQNLITVAEIENMAVYHPDIFIPAKQHLESYKLTEDESLDFRKDQEYYREFAKLKSQEKRSQRAKEMVLDYFKRAEDELLRDAKKAGKAQRRK